MQSYTLSVFLLSSLVLGACAAPPSASNPTSATACQPATEQEIAALFERWNGSLKTGDPKKVVANYDANSILLPTVSNVPRLTHKEREDYFHHFLSSKPSGTIDKRHIQIGCNTALDAGLYTFKMGATGKEVKARYSYTYKWNGKEWLITSHHSSMMPEQKTAAKH